MRSLTAHPAPDPRTRKRPPTMPAFLALLTLASATFAAPPAADWTFPAGKWAAAEGTYEQSDLGGQTAAILNEPSLANTTVIVDFLIRPSGPGVRTAALILRATGTQSYYWVHLDSKFQQVILVRSTPADNWIEIKRARCALTQDAWHTAKSTCIGSEIAVELDGKEIIRATDATLKAGRVGLGTSEGQVVFRNLTVEGEVPDVTEPLKDETPPPPLYKIISRGDAAGPYQSFPDACRLQNGDIMAVFYAGYGHVSVPNAEWPKGGRVCMVRSSDEGHTWTQPEILYDDAEDNRDPHVAQLSDGRLVCSFFSYVPEEGKPTKIAVKLTWSEDGGRTWSPAQLVLDGHAESAPVRELRDGTYVLGVYYEGGQAYGGVVRSTDKGKTWSDIIPIGKGSGVYLDAETDVIECKDGSLFAALRSSKVNLHTSTSADGGLTWTPVKDSGFKGHAPHLTRLSTGEVLMTHRIPNTALHVSRDDCQTWQGPYELDRVGGAYPATVELKDGTVLAIYYTEGGGSHVRALRFRLKADGIEALPLDGN